MGFSSNYIKIWKNDHENFVGFFNLSSDLGKYLSCCYGPQGHFSYSLYMLHMHVTLLQHLCIIYSSWNISILLVSSTWNQCAMIPVMYSFLSDFFLVIISSNNLMRPWSEKICSVLLPAVHRETSRMFLNLSLPEPDVRLMGCQESPAGRTATTVQLTIFRHCYPEAITASQSLVRWWKD